jgi:signal peptidase I
MQRRKLFDTRYCREKRKATILACMLFWSILSYWCISRFVIGSTEVLGESMSPTLQDGDLLLIDRLTYHLRDPVRGEVVAIQLPDDTEMAVKRIIAGPCERVQTRDGQVWVNGRPLDESYLGVAVRTEPGGLSTKAYRVGAGCYFVLGDNRAHSLDSRFFGAIARDTIVGRVVRPWSAGLTPSPAKKAEARQPRSLQTRNPRSHGV